jgi:maltooligosyltrehalose trehalohydrolase
MPDAHAPPARSSSGGNDLARMVGPQITAIGARFRVWAPTAESVWLVPADGSREAVKLEREDAGFFCAELAAVKAGLRYRFRLDDRGPYPDPCSRFQPEGPHGPSMLVDPAAHAWSDRGWRGVEATGQVMYEMHIGTFTSAGTFDAAIAELAELKALGVTVLEVMPVCEFPGRWNWGYDGVNLYAPFHGYGDYDAFKRFVDAAHALGLAVVLDVVYNHIGPDGNYLACFSPDYFTDRYENEWGDAINFDGPDAGPVRAYFIDNAAYWIREFHLDGLRLDATQSIHDAGTPHVLAELSQRARAAAGSRSILITAENEPQDIRCVLPVDRGGFGLDAMWNDDFHHSARVALTGRHDGYLHDYRGRAQEFVSMVKRGFLYQGQYYPWQAKPRGTPVTDEPAWAFITFTQNHDQVANTLHGERVHRITSPGRNRALTALMLLAPQTPLLFMGQEFASDTAFTFFADHNPELSAKVHAGRREFLQQFTAYASPEAQARVPDPVAEQTFLDSKLDFSYRETHAEVYNLHRDLLRLRREDPVMRRQDRKGIDGAVLAERAFVLRWFSAQHGDRLLLVNLGDELELEPPAEPLLAPPGGGGWTLLWSSDDPRYAGHGVIEPCTDSGWRLSGESATLLGAG